MKLVKPSFEILHITPDPLSLIESAGRTCYKSEDRITDESAPQFAKMVIKRCHYSVIEHASATVKFVIDRGVSHELVRHRLCAFSQESTRYCNYGKAGQVTFVIPPWFPFLDDEWSDEDDYERLLRQQHGPPCIWVEAMYAAERAYLLLLKNGQTPQQARSVLPNSLKTEVVTTANLREWRHIFSLRCSKAAHPQMREVMIPLRKEIRRQVPVIFDDDRDDDFSVCPQCKKEFQEEAVEEAKQEGMFPFCSRRCQILADVKLAVPIQKQDECEEPKETI